MSLREPSDVGRSTVALIVQGFAGVGLNAVLGMALARSMTSDDFGEFSSARGMLGVTTVLATLGFAGLVMSLLPRALHAQDLPRARGLLVFMPRAAAAAGLLLAVIVVVGHAQIDADTVIEMGHFAAVMIFLPLSAAQAVLAAAAASLGNAVRANVVSRVALPVLALGFVGVFRIIQGWPLTVFDAAMVWGGALLFDALLTLRVLRRAPDTPPRKGLRKMERRKWLRAAMPYLGATAFLVWLDIGGLIVIGWIHADSESAAIFAAAAMLSALTLVPGISTSPLFLPRIAHAIDAGDMDRVRDIEKRRNRLVVPLTLAAGGLLAAFSDPLLDLFGEGYDAGVLAVRALVLAKTVNTVFAMAPPQLQYLKSLIGVVILGIACVVSVPLMIVMGGSNSASGVAIAQGLSLGGASIAVQVALVWLRRRKYPNTPTAPAAAGG